MADYAPLGTIAEVVLGKMLQPVQKKTTDRQMPYLRAAHVQPGGILDLDVTEKEMWFSETDAASLQLCAGDVVVVEGGAGVGRSAYLRRALPGWGFQNSILRLRGESADDGRYLAYALSSALDSGSIAAACDAATLAHFTAEKVGRFRVPFHDPASRRIIADYLDRETGEIDAMVAKMNELRAVLIMRREHAVSHALFGEGGYASLGYIVDCLPGFAFPSTGYTTDDSEIPLLRGVNVKPHGLDWSDAAYWPRDRADALEAYMLAPDDVVLGMDRPFIGSGTRVVQIEVDDPKMLLVQRVLRVRPATGANARFIYHALRSIEFREYATPEATGISVPHISEGQVRNFRMPLPTLDEQRRIADHLDEVTGRIDVMLAKAAELKTLLIERRAALITDVVTGRKKVA